MTEIIVTALLLVIAYCFLMMYRNELVCDYRIRYISEFGPHKYEEDLPGYDNMLSSHIEWPVARLRSYVKKGIL